MSSPSRSWCERVAGLVAGGFVAFAVALLPAFPPQAFPGESVPAFASAMRQASSAVMLPVSSGVMCPASSGVMRPASSGVMRPAFSRVLPAERVPGPVPLPIEAVLPDAEGTTLVVDLAAGAGAVTVTTGGVRRSARAEPVLAAGLAVTLVVDASAAGAVDLPGWLSAAARFVLGAPGGGPIAVIPDRAPAAVLETSPPGVAGVVRGLNTVRAEGERDTAAALSLAAGQFPGTPVGRRVVLLYTGAADAGGPGAAEIAARFRAAGVILVVVGRSPFWAEAVAGTGGFLAPAGEPGVVPALDQVETTLAGRHLVRLKERGPARVVVSVDTGEVMLTGEVTVPGVPGDKPVGAWWWWCAAVGGVLVMAGTGAFGWRVVGRSAQLAAARTAAGAGAGARPSMVMSPLPRGRAAVPPRPPGEPPPASGPRRDHS